MSSARRLDHHVTDRLIQQAPDERTKELVAEARYLSWLEEVRYEQLVEEFGLPLPIACMCDPILCAIDKQLTPIHDQLPEDFDLYPENPLPDEGPLPN